MSRSSRNQPETPALGPLSGIAAQIEAVLFLATSPVTEGELREVLGVSPSEVSAALRELDAHLLRGGHGLVLKALAGGWALETIPHFAEVLSRFRDTARKGKVRLSPAALEVAAIIAYNQPVTRGEIVELRGGIRSERIIDRLLDYGLVRLAGRRKGSGSPLLYRTTPRFLEVFGLEGLSDLPSLEELGELGGSPVEAAAEPEAEAAPEEGAEMVPAEPAPEEAVGASPESEAEAASEAMSTPEKEPDAAQEPGPEAAPGASDTGRSADPQG